MKSPSIWQGERPNILLINCVLANGGDAAIFEAVKDTLLEATRGHCAIRVLDDLPAVGRRLYPGENIGSSCFSEIWWYCRWSWLLPLKRFFRVWLVQMALRSGHVGLGRLVDWALSKAERAYVSTYLAADLIVATGGTYLTEHYDLNQRAFDMANAIYAEKPLVLMPQSVGKITGRPETPRLRFALLNAVRIYLRDRQSVRNVSEVMGSSGRIETLPDIVFRLSRLATEDRRPCSSGLKNIRRVAISVREWPYFSGLEVGEGMRTYVTAMAALADHIAQEYGADITFISTCQGIPEYRYDDSRIAETIRSQCGHRGKMKVDSEFHTADELRRLLGGFDLVVATRMHAAILSLVARTPVFPIAYEFKTTELFRALGYRDIVTIDRIGERDLAASLDAFVADLPDIQPRSIEIVDGFRKELQHVVDTLSTLVGPTGERAPT